MDNLTHGLIGYTIYKSTVPLVAGDSQTEKRLLWASVLASELPDGDMISAFFGSASSLLWHRTYTHSVLGILFLAVFLGAVVLKFWPELPRKRLFGLILAGLAAHSFLDVLTSYGTKVLLPWSATPYAWDILPIIDPYLLLILGGFLWAGWKNKSKPVLISLVLLMVLYIGARVYVHNSIYDNVRSQVPAAQQVIVMPTIGSFNKWRFTAALPAGYEAGDAYFSGEIKPDIFIPDVSANPAVLAAAKTRAASVIKFFARQVAYRVEPVNEGWHVTVFDPRYAYPDRTMFVGNIIVDKDYNVVQDKVGRQ
jgi:inner membrane protein